MELRREAHLVRVVWSVPPQQQAQDRTAQLPLQLQPEDPSEGSKSSPIQARCMTGNKGRSWQTGHI